MKKCDILNLQKLLGKKWTILIITMLNREKKLSFNQISNNLKKATNKIVSKRLEELEEHKLIEKKIINKRPMRTNYNLTERGIEIIHLFNSMKRFGIKHKLVPSNCEENSCDKCSIAKENYI